MAAVPILVADHLAQHLADNLTENLTDHHLPARLSYLPVHHQPINALSQYVGRNIKFPWFTILRVGALFCSYVRS